MKIKLAVILAGVLAVSLIGFTIVKAAENSNNRKAPGTMADQMTSSMRSDMGAEGNNSMPGMCDKMNSGEMPKACPMMGDDGSAKDCPMMSEDNSTTDCPMMSGDNSSSDADNMDGMMGMMGTMDHGQSDSDQ